MDYLVIEGVRPYDGRYEFDLDGQELTTREWGWIKRLSSYLPLTASDGFANGDPELMTVLAAILLRRAGRITTQDVPSVYETLADAPFTATLRWETDTVEELAEGDAAEDPTASSNGSTESSGTASQTSSESSAAQSSPTGTPDSVTSVLGPPTLGS